MLAIVPVLWYGYLQGRQTSYQVAFVPGRLRWLACEMAPDSAAAREITALVDELLR